MKSKYRFGVAVALGLICTSSLAFGQNSTETLQLSGLTEPVEILKDHWGISHIYAKNELDLFFAQGYNVARDRLFQLELWRRQATGTTAEILGAKELKRDIGNRLFMYRGDLKEELNWYHPHGAAIVESFVNGINAYIGETEKNPQLLTPEFKMLDLVPGRWTPAVVISRFNGLLGNIDQEVNIALAIRTIGTEKVKDIEYFQPANPKLEMDPAIDASLLKKEILELYDAYRRPIAFTADELSPAYRDNQKALLLLQDRTLDPPVMDWSQQLQEIGSNNWIVSGALTAHGFPMMVNDPHRVQQTPSLRYWVHLVAPGWNVIGGGEPALPGVSIGHNDFGAWGLTIFGTDSEDLYVYDTNPLNPSQYKYNDGWETMTVVKETIPVKGQAPANVELKYTRHGPIVFEDQEHRKAYAVRAAWREVGGAPYLASLRMDQAENWDQFRDACSFSRTPAENMIWADRQGNIGYQAVGIAPRRPKWSGLVPVSGDGRYEWDGYLPPKDLPNLLNPSKGFFNTSNNYLIPPGWPYRDALHYLWADAYRADSVAEILSSGRRFTVADMVQMQNAEFSIPARSLVPLLRDISIESAAVQDARNRLLRWDFILDKDSVAAGIYEMWQRRLQANVRDIVVPKQVQPYLGNVSMTNIVSWLHAPDGRFGTNPLAARDEVLVKSLSEAVAELARRLGPDREKWKLGAYHHALIPHFMNGALSAEQRRQFNVGDLPRGGDAYTINATGDGDNQTSGGSFKIIVDTENWDNSIGMNNPGQSGDITSQHYRDLYELWARGRYFPIFYSRTKIESVTEKTIKLEPLRGR
jgi:penicillin G amidase